MVMEFYTAEQEWPISLPEEPPRDRVIKAVKGGREITIRWEWSPTTQSWRSPETVQYCMVHGWSLRSLPVPPVVDPIDVGTAAMVRQQLATHVTIPASVKQHCQFDNVTDDGKDEWRAIFRAGLEAYLAAGGAGWGQTREECSWASSGTAGEVVIQCGCGTHVGEPWGSASDGDT